MAVKVKKPKPTPAVAPTVQSTKSPAMLPKWLPYAIGGVGIVIVLGLLFLAKGKD